MSPRGTPFRQALAREWAAGPGLVILCPRFEGVDERVIEGRGLMEVSIGDYVLSGGEIAALAVLDACVRLIPGVMGEDRVRAEREFRGRAARISAIYEAARMGGPDDPRGPAVGRPREDRALAARGGGADHEGAAAGFGAIGRSWKRWADRGLRIAAMRDGCALAQRCQRHDACAPFSCVFLRSNCRPHNGKRRSRSVNASNARSHPSDARRSLYRSDFPLPSATAYGSCRTVSAGRLSSSSRPQSAAPATAAAQSAAGADLRNRRVRASSGQQRPATQSVSPGRRRRSRRPAAAQRPRERLREFPPRRTGTRRSRATAQARRFPAAHREGTRVRRWKTFLRLAANAIGRPRLRFATARRRRPAASGPRETKTSA